ncbi:hypothetical protein ACFVS2_26615 [Brevibacillus sp. NPDC058079]|uniref:hypothetical protein n=1 Tax=Brevibacillus sp. NPDC058079 TaxID=3346330 RepID=UPI0036E20F03
MDLLQYTYIDMIGIRIIVSLTDENDKLIPMEDFSVKDNDGYPYLTLSDIADQLTMHFGEKLQCIDVWEELGLNGVIYRYTTFEKLWREHGKTKGHA